MHPCFPTAEKDDELAGMSRQVASLKALLDEAKAKAQREAQAQEEADTIRKKLARDNELLVSQLEEVCS